LKYVKSIFDPCADGNCGFQCIARALGYDKDGWLLVRNKILQQVSQNKPVYSKLQGKKKSINKIIGGLVVASLKAKIGKDQWLNKLLHGHILANLYWQPIIFIGLTGSALFLPLQLGPGPSNSDPIYLLHINSNHWVLADIEEEEGVSPIPPAFLVAKHTHKSAKDWHIHIQKGRDLYKEIIATKAK
jgi:hypothetical protein